MASRLIVAALAALVAAAAVADPVEPAKTATAALRLSYEVAAAEALKALQGRTPVGSVRLDNVQIVDARTGRVSSGQTVITSGSRIQWTGPTSAAPDSPDAVQIDGGGRFAAPGLADMHIHSSRADGWLLNLAAGVTTVRDMDGFPWHLRAREHIVARRMLGPTPYVAGTIIAAAPLDGYAVLAIEPTQARSIVRKQAACGYDFIKVHNVLPKATLDAVADQAATLGMHVVGHVPHDISVDHALHSAKMRTTEHLKGFLNDRTLLPSDEDYGAALAGTRSWITPTLYTRRGYDRGAWAKGVLASREAAYVPPYVRSRWADMLANPNRDDVKLGERFVNTQRIVMDRLRPLRPHWLAGTDAAGYPFNIMGFALHDELALMQQAGLSPAEAYRAATVEAADALGEAEVFGEIRPGMRADLILLDQNPMVETRALSSHRGVMVRGRWIDRVNIDQALAELASAYAIRRPAVTGQPSALVARLAKATADGFVFDDGMLERFEQELAKAGHRALSERVHALQVNPSAGSCSVPNPED